MDKTSPARTKTPTSQSSEAIEKMVVDASVAEETHSLMNVDHTGMLVGGTLTRSSKNLLAPMQTDLCAHSELVAAIKGLATSVDALAARLEQSDVRGGRIEQCLDSLCKVLVRMESNMPETSSEKDMGESQQDIPFTNKDILDGDFVTTTQEGLGKCQEWLTGKSATAIAFPCSPLPQGDVPAANNKQCIQMNSIPATSILNAGSSIGAGSQNSQLPLMGRPTMIYKGGSSSSAVYPIQRGKIGNSKTNIPIREQETLHRVPSRRGGSSANGQKGNRGSTLKLFGSVMNATTNHNVVNNNIIEMNPTMSPSPTEPSLSELQISIATYVFNPQGNQEEVLVKYGDLMMTRAELMTLKPDGPVIWCLPPSFSNDVINDIDVQQITETYMPTWMRPSMNLNYAYIPVKEDEGHWFLAVVAFKDEVLYHLDASMDDEKALRRKATIRKLGDGLSAVIGKPKYPLQFSKKYKGVTYFRIREADGLPTAQSRETSAISVLNWMAMANAFQRNLMPQLDENLVRMHTALGLVMAPFNEVTSWIPSIGAKV
ncbi:Ulp1 protease family, carboxy-terminal domain protein [Arachis hypogaea]|nr:Ulp1 protease family, carboxy-terminal domain protein [Arachis hypogaea]